MGKRRVWRKEAAVTSIDFARCRKAPSVMLDIFEGALALGIKAPYVLFDSWFASPTAIPSVLERGLHAIAMLKKTSTVHSFYNSEMLSATETREKTTSFSFQPMRPFMKRRLSGFTTNVGR